MAAAQTQAATRAGLGVLGDAFSCAEARLVAYRRSTAEPEITDQWYVASQQWADATLLQALAPPSTDASAPDASAPLAEAVPAVAPVLPDWNAADARCYLQKGFIFLDRLWDYSAGGYFPSSNPVGTNVPSDVRYADDNSLAGLALVDAALSEPDAAMRRQYLHAAAREADFLTQSGLWDTTFGGGFWWNTGRGTTAEGKPAQSNAIAALFFARLYDATGDPTYRDWAARTLLWLDTVLYDPSRSLYRWSVSYQDLTARTGAVISQRYFNYDQGIAIEAELDSARQTGDLGRAARARAVGQAIEPAFWSASQGGYDLEAGIEQVYTAYAAWTSLGHLALYDSDGDPHWLDLARRNADALDTRLREADGGYGLRAYRCVDRVAPGCESGQVASVVDHTRDGAAQAWAQRLQTEIGRRELAAAPAPAAAG